MVLLVSALHCTFGGILYHGAFHCKFLSFSNRVFASYEVWLSTACPAVALVLVKSHLIYVKYSLSHRCASSFFGLARSFLTIHFWSGFNCLGSDAKLNSYPYSATSLLVPSALDLHNICSVPSSRKFCVLLKRREYRRLDPTSTARTSSHILLEQESCLPYHVESTRPIGHSMGK